MTESATGEVRNGSIPLVTSYSPYSVNFDYPRTFKPGLPWVVRVTSEYPDATPLDGTWTLSVTASRQDGTNVVPPTQTVTTVGGAGSFSVLVPKPASSCCNASAAVYSNGTACCVNTVSVDLVANSDNVYGGAYANADTSPAQEFLSLGAQEPAGPAAAGSTVSFKVSSTPAQPPPVAWALIGSKGVAASGVAAPGQAISFQVPAGVGASPALLAFFQNSLGVAADSVAVSTVPSLPQQVSAQFNASSAEPGDPVAVSASLRGTPDASARVWLLAVDKSVSLLGESTALNGSSLLAQVAEATASSASSVQDSFMFSRCWGTQTPQDVAGAILFTPLAVPKCSSMSGWRGGDMVAMGMPMAEAADSAAGSAAKGASPAAPGAPATPTTRVRKLFPETWLWFSLPVDGSGAASRALTVPDTITSWQLTAFAAGPAGLGVAPAPAELAVSQAFFLRPALPYSLARAGPMEPAPASI